MSNRKPSHQKYDPMEVYGFICQYKRRMDGNSPSVRDIVSSLEMSSTSTAWYWLKRLVQLGLIELHGNGSARSNRTIIVKGGTWTAPTHQPVAK